MKKKNLLMAAALMLSSAAAHADEGMWTLYNRRTEPYIADAIAYWTVAILLTFFFLTIRLVS